MAVMFMDGLLERFNMTTLGAAKLGFSLDTMKIRFVHGVEISMTTKVTSLNRSSF